MKDSQYPAQTPTQKRLLSIFETLTDDYGLESVRKHWDIFQKTAINCTQNPSDELTISHHDLQNSNRELQAVNQQLDSINIEYQRKIREFIELQDDTNNLLASTDIGVVFLDENFLIRKISPGISENFHIHDSDLGKDIRGVSHLLQYPELAQDLEWVRRHQQVRERDLPLEEQHHFLLRINPYQGNASKSGLILSLVEITSIHQAEQQASKIGNTLSAVVKHFPEMLIVVDTHQNITFSSPDAASFIKAHGHGSLPLGLDDTVSEAIVTKRSFLPLDFKGVKNLVLNDGSTRSYLPRVTILDGDQEEVSGAVITIQDVTEFRMLDEIKTSLISTVSHELKNPIGGITMSIGLVLDESLGHLNPEQKSSLEDAMHECERLTSTVKGLLDLARFDEGGKTARRTQEQPSALIKKAMKNNQLLASRKHILLKSQLPSSLPTINCDTEHILMVLNNLISNALKHSPESETILLTAKETHSGDLQFSVSDQGPGIPEKFQNQVFTKFFRTPHNTHKGSGLGLNIAKQLVEAHAGKIFFNNNSPRGCTFSFTLPR